MVANHTISILVINEAGVLSRVVDLFSGRGYNIESLTVAPTIDKNYSRVTIVTQGDDRVIEQINKQLNRLIPIIKVMDLPTGDAIETEIVLAKVYVTDETRAEIIKVADLCGARVLDITDKTYTLQLVGDDKQIRALGEMLRPIGVKEFIRSGKVALSRGNQFANINLE